ncbi:hypothetical protein [Stenotrophomonas maltophilia]|uniref:hypothetical protein n=1 Tax=Stenotrophomonas maltophilia TaxID=40324 RepID=UPI0011B82446|nr:hypothetical protein [Stenotrophomonas maltophilia]
MITFAVALARQEMTDRRSSAQKEQASRALLQERQEHSEQQRMANEALLAESERNRRLRAKAIAISIKPQLNRFNAVMQVIRESGCPDTPREAFDEIGPSLEIRHRGIEALELGECSEAVLDVIEAAQTLYEYLKSCKATGKFEPENMRLIDTLAIDIEHTGEEAIDAILEIVHRSVNA